MSVTRQPVGAFSTSYGPQSDATNAPGPSAWTRLASGGTVDALDGLRAVAVLAVVARHVAGYVQPQNDLHEALRLISEVGWSGVDLFFVLSGFLITGGLLRTRDAPGYFSRFYSRRSLRILPLYFLVVAACLFWLVPLLARNAPPGDRYDVSQAWYWTHTLNVLVAREGWNAALPGTAHLWSLAVEEQFYLVWPLVVFFVPRSMLAPVTLSLIVGSALARGIAVLAGVDSIAAYALTPFRLDSLLLGALLAMPASPEARARVRSLLRRAARIAGIVVVAVLVVQRRPLQPLDPLTLAFVFPGVAILFATLLDAVMDAPRGARLTRFLEQAPLRFVGRISYGVYLIHIPVVTLLLAFGPGPYLLGVGAWLTPLSWAVFLLVVVAATLALSSLTWVFLERPCLSLKRYFPTPTGCGGGHVAPAESR